MRYHHSHPLSRIAGRAGLLVLITCASVSAWCSTAIAGTYPMYQCTTTVPAVSPGWSVYGFGTIASTVLSNSCSSSGGRIGDYVFTDGQAGAVTENGSSGSQVDLAIEVPASIPDVTIHSLSANVTASSVSGDDAWLGFASAGQGLPGGVELPYDTGSDYTASDTWTLPQEARQFVAYVNCSTDRSSTTCLFSDSIAVPALSDITLTLAQTAPPTIENTSGALDSAAASGATVTGSQTLSFTGSDPGSGVRQATLTLIPQDGQPSYKHTFDFSSECAYEAWNACPLTQTVSAFTLNTATLKDTTYTVELTVEDAAANTTSKQLGTITTNNAPANTTAPSILVPGGETLVGSTLTIQPGAWSAPTEAGTVSYAYQWEQCDSKANNCELITNAQTASYTPANTDTGHTLRATVTATDNDGSTSITSAPTSIITTPPSQLTNLPGPSTTSTGLTTPNAPGTTGGNGTPNGTPASDTAILHINGKTAITRSYARRAFKLTGQLTTSQTQPIANATLDVLEQTIGTSTPNLITHTTTSPDGTFTLKVPAGPSRTITIAYRAHSGDPGYTATAHLSENVHASARLKITPHHISTTGTIIIKGHVQGPIPPQGTIVELLVRYHGHWEPFRDPRTNKHGHFHLAYQFQGAIGHFPFKVEIPAGQTGYPYTKGHSNTVTITTR